MSDKMFGVALATVQFFFCLSDCVRSFKVAGMGINKKDEQAADGNVRENCVT